MSKDIYIMPINIACLVKNPNGFFNTERWVCHHTVKMVNGDNHVVTEETFLFLKNLLWVHGDREFHNTKDLEMKQRELTTLFKINLLT